MNKQLISYMLNVAIILGAVVGGPYVLDALGITGAVPRMLSIGLIAGAMTLGFERLGLLPHLRKKNDDPTKGPDA